MFHKHEGKVKHFRCPVCGTERPHDWFLEPGGACWRCRAFGYGEQREGDAESIKAIRMKIARDGRRKRKEVSRDDLLIG